MAECGGVQGGEVCGLLGKVAACTAKCLERCSEYVGLDPLCTQEPLGVLKPDAEQIAAPQTASQSNPHFLLRLGAASETFLTQPSRQSLPVSQN